MSDQTCDCCGSSIDGETGSATPGRWLGGDSVLDAPVPVALGESLGRLTGTQIETLDGFVSVVRSAVGGTLSVEELCHTTEETPHTARIGSVTHQFRCFFDSVALAQITGEPVEFTTESPAGESIDGHIDATGGVTTEPEGVVMSFGVSPSVRTDEPTDLSSAVEAAICPYIRAFTDRERYEQWDDRVAAATVGMTLSAGVPFAAALTK